MPNNDILKKMYKNGSLVSVVNMSQEGMAMPANIEAWALNTYKSANNWKTYASRIQAIPNS